MIRIILLIIISSTVVSCSEKYPKKIYEEGELFFSKSVTESEVDKAGYFLVEMDFFEKERKTSILLDKHEDTFVFSIVVDKLYHNDTSYDSKFRSLATLASLTVFSGTPARVVLADRSLQPKRRID
jgi:hypothetical protein